METMDRTNDATDNSPRVEAYLNMSTLDHLPSWSSAPAVLASTEIGEVTNSLLSAGYTGVQCLDPERYMAAGLRGCILGRANTPQEIRELTRSWSGRGLDCGTLHVGWGFESSEESAACARTVVECSEKYRLPLYIEIHRATIVQDPWRTLQLVEAVPQVRFNGDFSHWYTGLELVYGDIVHKWDLLQPVFDRVRFMHLRVGNSSTMQLTLKEPSMAVAMEHYREMWQRSMAGFLDGAAPGDFFIVAPELLSSTPNYARLVFNSQDETWREDSDRWQESLALVEVARECFRRVSGDSR